MWSKCPINFADTLANGPRNYQYQERGQRKDGAPHTRTTHRAGGHLKQNIWREHKSSRHRKLYRMIMYKISLFECTVKYVDEHM